MLTDRFNKLNCPSMTSAVYSFLVACWKASISISVYPNTELILYAADAATMAVGKQHLHPEGTWFTTTSGIWQTVWLEPVGRSLSSLCLFLELPQCMHHVPRTL